MYRIRRRRLTGPALRGIARIQSLESTATRINDRNVCKIALRVEVSGHEPYDVTVRRAVHPTSMASVRPGLLVRVEVDPADLRKVRIGSGQPISAATLASAYNEHKRIHGNHSGRWASAAELLESGQRVPGLLRSFAATGNTLRSLGRAATAAPELLDAPQFVIEVELHFSDLAPVIGRNVQSIPACAAREFAVGLELTCVVDPADPGDRFVVDWWSLMA